MKLCNNNFELLFSVVLRVCIKFQYIRPFDLYPVLSLKLAALLTSFHQVR